MASSVMKSKVFFLVIVLLVCSSYANDDDIPQVSEVHRKLLGVFGAFLPKVSGVLPDLGNGAKTSLDKVKLNPNIGKGFGETSSLPKSQQYKPRPNDHWTYGETTTTTLTEFLLKKAAEQTAERLFGADFKRGFRLGWKIGKKYYSVANKCEKYANENLQCDNTTLQCESSQSVTCVPYCVVEIVEGIKDTCYEKNGVPEETPCNSSNGTIYLGTTPITYQSAPTKCMP